MINEEAIRQAVKAIEADPEHWDQMAWVGLTSNGMRATNASAVMRDGDFRGFSPDEYRHPKEIPFNQLVWRRVDQCESTYCLAGQALLHAGMVDKDGHYTDGTGRTVDNHGATFNLAKELLGLTESQADQLFYWGVHNSGGTLADFKAHITKVTGVRFEDE